MRTISVQQRGSVSIFVVVFAALLIVTISITFIRLMVQDQIQATNNDLSRSALDSADAGVEDAKRLLIKYNKECTTSTPYCDALLLRMNGTDCAVLSALTGTVGETRVGDEALQQAHTCVKIWYNTDDYIGTLTPGVSRMVRLSGASPFTKVKIEWYSKSNLQASNTPSELQLNTNPELKSSSDWPTGMPSLLRAQLLQVGQEFTLSQFDSFDSDNSYTDNDNSGTLFMIPASVGTNSLTFGVGRSEPRQPVRCVQAFATTDDRFACWVEIDLYNPDDPADSAVSIDRSDAYLRLGAPYNYATDFKVTLFDGSGAQVKFKGVQPRVDSTGRAGDLFRRVDSRVELTGNNFPYIEGALDITGDLCKAFEVTSSPAGYLDHCPKSDS